MTCSQILVLSIWWKLNFIRTWISWFNWLAWIFFICTALSKFNLIDSFYWLLDIILIHFVIISFNLIAYNLITLGNWFHSLLSACEWRHVSAAAKCVGVLFNCFILEFFRAINFRGRYKLLLWMSAYRWFLLYVVIIYKSILNLFIFSILFIVNHQIHNLSRSMLRILVVKGSSCFFFFIIHVIIFL